MVDLKDVSWHELVAMTQDGRTGLREAGVTEAIRRLGEALRSQEASANRVGDRLWWLNVWLLVFTVPILFLTGFQAWVAWRS